MSVLLAVQVGDACPVGARPVGDGVSGLGVAGVDAVEFGDHPPCGSAQPTDPGRPEPGAVAALLGAVGAAGVVAVGGGVVSAAARAGTAQPAGEDAHRVTP